MEEHPFALMIGVQDNIPFATHLPLVVQPATRTLLGHVARANPHAQLILAAQPQLIVFSGPHAYISPKWYAEVPAVPTWNYLAVHVTGTPCPIHDPQLAASALMEITRRFDNPAQLPLPDAASVQSITEAILAFEIHITTVTGKAKLSQNRSELDRTLAAQALAATQRPEDLAIARLMLELQNTTPRHDETASPQVQHEAG
jgi:transcriptional regulator